MIQLKRLTCNGHIAPLGVAPSVLLQWSYSGSERSAVQTAYRITASVIAADDSTERIYDSGEQQSAVMRHLFPSELLKPETAYLWTLETTVGGKKLRRSSIFETATDKLASARYIVSPTEPEEAAVAFVRDLTVTEKPVRARAYLFGLGFYTAEIDGCRITEARYLSANTRYSERCLFETYDILPLLRRGKNHIRVTVGGGYNKDFSQYGYLYDNKKGVRGLFVLTYADGHEERIVTDESWQTAATPVRENSIYGGETYDARIAETPFGNAVAADDAFPKGVLCPDELPPILPTESVEPVQAWQAEDGGVIYDFGKNIAGVTEITVTAPVGTELTIRHSELIDKDGEMKYRTNRRAAVIDRYICGGGESESWSPRFTYHGFRYVKVYGVGSCEAFAIKSLPLSAEQTQQSDFVCSDPTVNRIHEHSLRSIRANHYSYPTDCPVRDERTPCMMDSQMYERSALLNFADAYPYYRKWFGDICFGEPRYGNPDWHGDIFSVAFHLWEIAGDDRIAVENYDKFMRYLHYYTENWENGLWVKGYGDWCAPNENTWQSFFSSVTAVNTALMYWDFVIVQKIARKLNRTGDIAWITEQIGRIRAAFANERHEDGSVGSGRQAELCVPLFYRLIDGDNAVVTAKALADRVRSDGHFDTGAYGTPAIGEALADYGYVDEYFKILTETEFPGYGWQIANGATSLWEQWAYDGIMHTHSHAFYSGIDASFYRIFCGIRPTGDGFTAVRIAPCLPEKMTFASCSLGTVSGEYRVKIEKISGGFTLNAVIPVNTSAEVVFPAVENKDGYVLFDGERMLDFTDSITVGSGSYCFRAVPKKYLYEQVY